MSKGDAVYWEENPGPIDNEYLDFLRFLHRYEIREPSIMGPDRVIAIAFSRYDAERLTDAINGKVASKTHA